MSMAASVANSLAMEASFVKGCPASQSAAVFQEHLGNRGAVEPHLLEFRSDPKPGVITPDEKCADPLRTGTRPCGGKDDIESGLAGVADKDLGSVQHIPSITAGCGRAEVGRIGSPGPPGRRGGRQPLAPRQDRP